jgi:uncharacterized protein (TIGR03089 family)
MSAADAARRPEDWFDYLVHAEPARPFVTYYDEATGERSELSVRSLGNWVAKTHFLLLDELGLGGGDRALLALPFHWISVPIVLGCLTAGLEIVTAGRAEVAFVQPSSMERAAEIEDVYAIAPERAALGFGAAPPAGAGDYVTAVRPQADKWPGVQLAAAPGDACLDGAPRADVTARARDRAAELGLAAGARVLSDRDWASADDLVDTLLAPLAVLGSVVYVRNADAATLERRAGQEKATARV